MGGEPDPADRDRAQQLAVRRLAARRQASRRRDELGALGRLNGHEPHGYLKDIMQRLPTQPASRIGELLPHRWQPVQA
ncbi:MAG: transposase domain-containing protein [Comamonadaceae bacterium]|nr:MAG: transposase domain-containing protein [Comamonadaceae bacterium]